MFKACKFSLFDSKSTNDLCQDDDKQPDLACTSQLQKWHKKGQGDKISAQPVMEVTVEKTKLDEARSREGVKGLIYDARCNPKHNFQAEMNFKKALEKINPQMGLSIMAREDSSLNKCMETRFGESKIGSICSYQLTHTVPRDDSVETELTYPRFPLNLSGDFVWPDNLTESEKALISSLMVDETKINNIEEATRDQASSAQ